MPKFTKFLGIVTFLSICAFTIAKKGPFLAKKQSVDAANSTASSADNTAKNQTKYVLAKDQSLVIGNGAEPKELDPALATGDVEAHVLDNLFEGLVALDHETLQPIPAMAESWTVSPDGKKYVFKIRPNARWSDGKEITAEDFVWSWERALTPMTAAEYAYQLYYIKNGEKFNKGQIKDPKQLGVKATDKLTLEVELENPTPFFLQLAAFHTLNVVPKHVVTKFSGQDWTKEGNLVSNGPYKLKEWKLNRHIILVPNEYYWDKDAVKLTQLTFSPTENADTEEKMFISGKLHMTSTVPTLRIPYYRAQENKNVDAYHPFKLTPQLASYFYRFNVKRKPTDDLRVRRALSLAIDRKAIVERILQGGQTPATSFTPPVMGYSFKGDMPDTVTPAAIAEAKKLLAEAGYPDGKGLPSIEILYNTNEAHKKIAVAIQDMWKKNLGIDAVLFNQEWKVYIDAQRKMNFTVSRSGWIGDYPDPNTFLDMFLTNGGNNLTGWSNKDYDENIHLAGQTLDQQKRFEYFHKAEAILLKELPVLPIYFYTKNTLVSEHMKRFKDGKIVDWTSNIINRLTLKNVVVADPVK